MVKFESEKELNEFLTNGVVWQVKTAFEDHKVYNLKTMRDQGYLAKNTLDMTKQKYWESLKYDKGATNEYAHDYIILLEGEVK